MLDAVLTFDVEDVYFDPREGGDDHPIWIARTLEQYGLQGTFLFVGDKVRRLRKNRRQDVAKALAGHSVGMHVNSNRHPTMPEQVAPLDWWEGLKRVRDEETRFAREFEEFFGRPPEATSRHHVIGATQQYRVAAEMGLISFYGVPASTPQINDISFCCGALTTPVETVGFVGTGFDRAYSDDARTDACIRELDQQISLCHDKGRTFLNIFLGHPVMMRGVSPWFIYYLWPNGQNLSDAEAALLGTAPIKPASVMPTVQRNFARMCRFIAEHSDLEVITPGEVQRRYGGQHRFVTLPALLAYIDRANGTRRDTPLDYVGEIPLDDDFTPAELLAAASDGLLTWKSGGAVPQQVARRDVLGPLELPWVCPQLSMLTLPQLLQCAGGVVDEIVRSGHLPGNFELDGRRLGLGSYFQALLEFYRRVTGREPVDLIPLPRVSMRYPSLAHDIDAQWRRLLCEDGTVNPEIDMELFCRYARLQSWTVKRAKRNIS